jgi:dTDP-glucose 4,6-dehydratase
MSHTLVTGGAGFIGSNFVELLFDRTPSDHRITVLDVFTYAANPANIPSRIQNSPRFKLVRGDIRDPEVVNRLISDVDRVAHFAAESHVTRSIADDRPFFETDVMGTQTIAAAISRSLGHIKKFLHISTSEVYGTAARAPMDEEHPLNPCTPYAAAKAGADRLVYAYRETYQIPTVIIRPFNNYGPKQHLEKVVPRFITSALLDKPMTVHGDGKMTRDWIFVKDTCEGVFRALFSDVTTGEVINLGTGIDTSVMTIAEMILDVLGKPKDLIRHVEARPGQVDRHISNVDKSARLLDGWKTEVRLYEGLRSTIEWYKTNRSWWLDQVETAQISVTDASRKLSGSF